MALASHLVQIGLSSREADFLGDTHEISIAATGTTQGGAYQLSKTFSSVLTVTAASAEAVKLPTSSNAKNSVYYIRNNSGKTISVFPGSGDYIDNEAVDAAIRLQPDRGLFFFKVAASATVIYWQTSHHILNGEDGIAATGTTQNGAYGLTAAITHVTTATVGVNDGVRLPVVAAARFEQYTVRNGTGGNINVFPGSTDFINHLGTNNPIVLPANTGAIFSRTNTSGRWVTVGV